MVSIVLQAYECQDQDVWGSEMDNEPMLFTALLIKKNEDIYSYVNGSVRDIWYITAQHND